MTDARQTPEDPVIKHVREQHNVEPPAHLDAFILNAAHRETPVSKPGLWQRWLRACQKPRWQVAFASLVGVALMLSLVQRAPEPLPQFDYAPAAKPAAPLARKQALEAQSLPAPPAAAKSAPAPAPMMEMAEPMQSDSISADEARLSKRAAPRPTAWMSNCAKSCACATPASRKPLTRYTTTCTNATPAWTSTGDSKKSARTDRLFTQPFGIARQKRALSGHG